MSNIFLEFEKKYSVKIDDIPEWAKHNDISLKAYKIILRRSEEIESLLKSTPEKFIKKLLVSQKQIKIAELANEIGCSRAALSKTRRPELNTFVEKLNVKLSAEYKINLQKKVNGRKAVKEELEARCSELERRFNAAMRLKVGEVLENIFDNKIIEEQRILSLKLEATQIENKQNKEKLVIKNETINSLINQLNSSNKRIRELESEVKSLKDSSKHAKTKNN